MSFSIFERRYFQFAGILSSLCIGLVIGRWAITGSNRYFFLIENLVLAGLALLFGWLLIRRLKKNIPTDLKTVLLGMAWLAFLPNTWYVVTDFIHLENSAAISQLYDILMFSSLVICGFLFGFTSLYLMHRQLIKITSRFWAMTIILSIILISSFAIYLGRDLRWNSWDVLTDPGGLILSVTDRLLDPFGNPRLFNVTSIFFVFIGTVHIAIWRFLRPSSTRG